MNSMRGDDQIVQFMHMVLGSPREMLEDRAIESRGG